ncbi:calcium homeostasis modulator protein 3 isoform X1 [Echeneis naucrates]|uniref:calcium homeostasis modulator protein 3 isoform X1 n=1 Tax=Echeneis naucrates TaxID=173247 RepID=UPI001113FC80|nr:calcium homeostasis modulator protein 3-like isoform X1 [Echeneis naucrates]
MERLKLVLQYFQSNSESISNGICIILALVSVKLYTSFDFNCPCLPQYNKLYSLGVMIIPPIILFFLGILVNRHTGVMMDEWMRPTGNRSKNPAVVKYLFSAMMQRALLAPMVWILVTLLDGKIFICAFSVTVDPGLFSGTGSPGPGLSWFVLVCPGLSWFVMVCPGLSWFVLVCPGLSWFVLVCPGLSWFVLVCPGLSCVSSGLPNSTGLEVIRIMAKVPCKEDVIFKNSSFRKAVSRYIRCYSQAVGWSILLFLIILGALGRLVKPCFDDHATFLQTRYWSNYLDMEQKLFDETCVLHAREFAQNCVVQFFEDMREDTIFRLPHPPIISKFLDGWEEEEEERLHGITKQEQMDQLLNKWFYSKPELDVTRIAHRPRTCVTWEDRDRKILYSDV